MKTHEWTILFASAVFYAASWAGLVRLRSISLPAWYAVNAVIAIITILWFAFYFNTRQRFFDSQRWFISLFLLLLFTVTVGWSVLKGWAILFGAALAVVVLIWDVRGMADGIRERK